MKMKIDLDKMEDRAVKFLDDGKLGCAERALKQMLKNRPNCLPAHFHLARVYRKKNDFNSALYHARRTIRLNPFERNAYLNLGLIYDLMGRDKLAALNYKKELSSNPDSAETLWNIGRLCFRRHRWLAASKYLQHCFDIGFLYEVEETVDRLGECYYRLNDLRAYIRLFQTYVQMFPKASWAFANLGRAFLQAKDYKAALLNLSIAKRLGKKNIDIPFEVARKKYEYKQLKVVSPRSSGQELGGCM